MIVGVLGASGFLGINLMSYLEDCGIIAVPGSRSLSDSFSVDATKYQSVRDWIVNNKITHVVNLAAVCGGIGLNKVHPYELWSATTRISANVLDACITSDIKKVVMAGSVCSYAANCPVPFSEDNLMDFGMPEETNRAYGVSKLNGLIGAQAATKEFGISISNLIPVNMYGPHDHFDLENSHVIPAMINKIVSAKQSNEKVVRAWGDGTASREFLFVRDCAEAIVKALAIDTGTELINVGTGQEITIKNLVSEIADVIGYNGEFEYDSNQPNGQMRRCLDIRKAENILKWEPSTSLREGLEQTVSWYTDQKATL